MPAGTIIGIVVVLVLVVGYVVFMRHRLASSAGYSPLGGGAAARLRGQIKGADMSGITAKLQESRDGAWDERDFYVDLLAPDANPQVMDAWVRGGQELGIAHLIRGRLHIHRAWQARGHGTSDTVSDAGALGFEQHLQAAEEDLLRAAELYASDPTPWGFLLITARGLGRDLTVAQDYFSQAVRRDPQQWTAHVQMLMMLSQKWGGSHDAMFAFARQVASTQPASSDLGAILLLAHVERWLWEHSFEEDEAAARAYLKQPGVRQEGLAAYQRSLGSPTLVERSSTVKARNIAACFFYLTRQKTPLQAEVLAIGNAYTEIPWGYLDEPERAFAAAARFAYR